MDDPILQELISTLIASTVGTSVRGRVLYRHSTSKTQPEMPCVLLQRDDTGDRSPFAPLDTSPILITTCSKISVNEALALQHAITQLLDRQAFQRAGVYFVAYQQHLPVTSIEETGETVYMAHVEYGISSIGM